MVLTGPLPSSSCSRSSVDVMPSLLRMSCQSLSASLPETKLTARGFGAGDDGFFGAGGAALGFVSTTGVGARTGTNPTPSKRIGASSTLRSEKLKHCCESIASSSALVGRLPVVNSLMVMMCGLLIMRSPVG